jgi:type IX secretion system PorP/SprF family membrane protein
MRTAAHILALIAVLVVTTVTAQHTPITSQYLFNGLLINPAYAGSRDALTANLTHRQQWVGFDGAPVTQLLSVHAPVHDRKIGLGLMMYNDRIGVSRESGVMSSYAYRLKLPNGRLSLGLGAGFASSRSNWQDVALQQQNDVSFQPMERNSIRPTFSTGAFYYSKKSFIGISLPFLLEQRSVQPWEGEITYTRMLNMQPMLFGGHVIHMNHALKLKPSMLLRYSVDGSMQGDLSTNLIIHETLWIGASYRTNDAMVCMIEVLPAPQWRVGYSYDAGLSRLRHYHTGSHEIMVQYELGYRIKVRDPRYF